MDRGQLIKQVREGKDWSQRELARKAGISDSYVRHIESGARTATPLVIEKIGEALGVDLRTDAERAQARAGAHEIVKVPPMKRREIEAHAEAIVKREYPSAVEHGLPIPVAQFFGQLAEVAQRSGIPVPVVVDTFQNKVEGMTWCADSEGPINCQVRADVYERGLKGEPRDRFTIAHECAHALLHHHVLITQPGGMFRDADGMKPSERAVTSTLKVYEIADYQANAWAAAFLMSTAAIKAYLRAQDDLSNEVLIENLARHFQVSTAAAEYRMSTALPALGRM